MAARIFLSYSHEDEAYRNRVEKHLAMLQREGLIEVWTDHRITAGEELDDTISQALSSADVILLLISAGFISSNYCFSKEMTVAMERHHAGQSVVIPVIVHPCDWHSAPFGKLKATPTDGKAISLWANPEEAYSIVARDVRAAIEKLGHQRPGSAPKPARPAIQRAEPLPRSSNLRLKQEFSDLDKDTYLKEAFEFIARFFEGSLQELESRAPGVEGRFERVDSRTIVASIYKGGKRLSQCSIQLGSGMRAGGITYSANPSNHSTSYNEALSVHTDDQSMFLRSLGMANFGSNRDEQLSPEGGAELFWGMLIGPLQ